MAIHGGIIAGAKRDFLRGVHAEGDTYMIALYGPSANLNVFTMAYTPQGEVQGRGYRAGGQVLRGYKCDLDGATAILQWDTDPIWDNATIHARGAYIYNRSKGNLGLIVCEFNEDIISTNGRWKFPMPAFNGSQALIRFT